MASNNGWIGDREQLEHYLATVGADRDEDGKFLLYHDGVRSFMGGGQEMVVSGAVEYSVDGHRSNLAAGLASTSYGMKVAVY